MRYTFTGSLVAWFLITLCGCSGTAQPPAARDEASVPSSSRHVAAPLVDSWDAVYLQGIKVGYSHTSAVRDERDPNLVRWQNDVRMAIERFGQRSEQSIQLVSWETPDHYLVRYELNFGGRASSGQANDKVLGFFAVEQSLRDQPMTPGERRSVRSMMPLMNQPVVTTLIAKDYESTSVLSESRRLLRIEQETALPVGKPQQIVMWCDQTGEIIKARTDALGQEVIRTTQEAALDTKNQGSFDLAARSSIITARPPRDPHTASLARYQVTLADGDPSKVFATSAAQTIRPIAAQSAEITVRKLRNDLLSGVELPADSEPTAADRQPSSLIQSNDARVVEFARQASNFASDDWELARQLEAFVHRTISNKNLTQTFASAAEVAKSREGDCTEHAVLLAALCRARELPARTAMGLVYVDSLPGFAFHMWTEVYIEDRWLGLDGTMGRGGIGAGHLKLLHSSLAGDSAMVEMLPVLEILGKLKIEWVVVE